MYITGAIHTSTRLILWPQQYNLYLLQYHLHLSTYNCYEEIIPKHINYVSVFSPSVNTDQNSLYYIVKLLSVRCLPVESVTWWHDTQPGPGCRDTIEILIPAITQMSRPRHQTIIRWYHTIALCPLSTQAYVCMNDYRINQSTLAGGWGQRCHSLVTLAATCKGSREL